MFRRVIHNLTASGFGRIVGMLTPLLLTPMFARTWGTDLYGEWLMLSAVPAYLMLCPDFGITGAALNRMARLSAQGERERARVLFSSCFLLLSAGAGMLVLLVAAISGSISKLLPFEQIQVQEAAVILVLLCVQIMLNQLSFCMTASYRCTSRNARGMTIGTGVRFFQMLGGMALLYVGISCVNYALFLALGSFLQLCVLWLDKKIIAAWLSINLRGNDFRGLKNLFVEGLGFVLLPVTQAMQNQGFILIIGFVLNPHAVAIFQFARVALNGVMQIINMVFGAIYPELATMFTKQKAQGVHIIRLAIPGLLICSGLAVSLFAGFGEQIFLWWLGPTDGINNLMVSLIMLAAIPSVYQKASETVLMSHNLLHSAILPSLIVKSGGLLLGMALLSVFGLNSIGIALFLIEAGMAVVFGQLLVKRKLMTWNDFFVPLLPGKDDLSSTVLAFFKR